MSVKFSLLALLDGAPLGAAALQREFVERTSHTWELNIGQVFTTLQRLERDGLVTADEPAEDAIERYRLTDDGRAALAAWWSTPVGRGRPERDELVMKIALAATTPGVDVRSVVQVQRSETMRALRDLTRLSAHTEPDDRAFALVLDHRIFAAEAEMRWLDHVETRVARSESPEAAPAAARPAPGTRKAGQQV